MITNDLAAKFHLPPIEEYPFGDRDWYSTFLIQSDYVALKAAEAVYLGKKADEELAEIIEARAYAREQINALDAAQGSGDGTDYIG